MLDSKIQLCKNHFGISTIDQWQAVKPEWILNLDGVGPVTLDHIRMYLAAHGFTLQDDHTPEYWKQHLSEARICHTMGDPEEPGTDVHDVAPFTILIDSQEKKPFDFKGLKSDASAKGRPLIVPTRWEYLGVGQGDYQIAQRRGRVAIERKSCEDAQGTILGWPTAGQRENGQMSRRERFERELETLAAMEFGAVVVEVSFGKLLETVPKWGKKSAENNRKSLFRSILAWQQRYAGVQWVFCDTRRLAEITTFRILERFWRESSRAESQMERSSAGQA